MEEERLVLLKEHKDSQEKLTDLQTEKEQLTDKNQGLQSKVDVFEKELLTLRTDFKEVKEQMQKEQEKSAAAAEKAAQRIQGRRPLSKAGGTGGVSSARKSSGLRFKTEQTQPAATKAECENCKQTKQLIPKSTASGSEPVNKSLVSDNQVLTTELVIANREVTRLKAEARTNNDTHKKSEKENIDLKKQVQAKQTALEKLRKEKDELWAIVNTEKFKSIHSVEEEKKQLLEKLQLLEDQRKENKGQLAQESQQNQDLLSKIAEQSFEIERLKERETNRENLLNSLEDKANRYERQINQDQSSNQQT